MCSLRNIKGIQLVSLKKNLRNENIQSPNAAKRCLCNLRTHRRALDPGQRGQRLKSALLNDLGRAREMERKLETAELRRGRILFLLQDGGKKEEETGDGWMIEEEQDEDAKYFSNR